MRKLVILLILAVCVLFKGQVLGQVISFHRVKNVPEQVSEINAMAFDQDSVLWMATNRGLLKMRGEKIIQVYDKSRPLVYAYNSLYIDDHNTKWLGTYTSSIVRFTDSTDIEVVSFMEYTDNEYELVTGIARHENTIWATTAGGQLFSYNLEDKQLKERRVPDCESIYDLKIYHKNGDKWLATSSGLYEEKMLWSWKRIPYFRTARGIYRNKKEYWAVGQNKQNRTTLIYHLTYYLTFAGLIDFPQHQWKDMILEGMGDPYIRFNDVDFDANGFIWFATNDGIIRYDPEVGYAFSIRKDKYTDFNIDQVKNILVAKDDRIWVSSFGNVVYRIDFR